MTELTRLVLEIGPLIAFLLAYYSGDIWLATGVLIAATVASLICTWLLFRRLPVMPLVSGVILTVFGGLTLLLADEIYIKMKPTIVNTLFAAALLGGLAWNKLVWKILFKDVMQLQDEGWRALQIRWGLFFLFLAVLNEIIWRNFNTEVWVNFKVFVLAPMTFFFAVLQIGIVKRYWLPEQPLPGGSDRNSDGTRA